MPNFVYTPPIKRPNNTNYSTRLSQQMVKPTAIKPAAVNQVNMVNTNSEILGPFSLADGASGTIVSIVYNIVNDKFRLGAVPYNICFFEDGLTSADLIGYSITGYIINSMSMPTFTPIATQDADGTLTAMGGNDGNNLVFLTEIVNNTGAPHDIYVITNTRVWTPLGGDGA